MTRQLLAITARPRQIQRRAATRCRRAFFEALEPRTVLASDFGDAPDNGTGAALGNYQTLIADNGPRHDITATQSTLFLGARVDDEVDAIQNVRANGDDITTVPVDEDGLIEPNQDLVLTVGTTPQVRVRATNTTGAAATLYGWIDFNRDGLFDNATERVSVAVPAATTNGTFILTFPTIPLSTPAGATYARFRLSTDVLSANPTGAASGGEVEDYAATIVLRSDGTVDSAKTKKIGSGTNGGPTLADRDGFGHGIASLGDLDGDGIIDLAVGAPADSTEGDRKGAVHVLLLRGDGTVKNSVRIGSGVNGGPVLGQIDSFGNSLASLGDLDGDGVTDLAVGTPLDDTGGYGRGAVHVLFLHSNGTVKSSTKIANGTGGGPALADRDNFGSGMAALGDLDGDGVIELAVGAGLDDTGGPGRGAVYVLFMKPDGTAKSSVKIASGTNGGPVLANYDVFGVSVASLGDLDGDGVTDVSVGARTHGADGANGAIHILLLNSNGTVKSSTKIASATGGGPLLSGGDEFGFSAVSLGDLDGDGVTDLCVGAVGDNTAGLFGGAIYALLLNGNGTVKRSVKITDGTNGGPALEDHNFFGFSIGSLGDLDGDGIADLAVGAPGDDTGGTFRGAVHVLFLNALTITDFGDAPDAAIGTGLGNYQTLLADNGPRHDITATQSTLYLGARVDEEADAVQSVRANGDDITTLPRDEDGLIEPAQDLVLTVGTAPNVRVRATNTTGAAASLYGWIDVNRDGVFDNATERASVAVPAETTNGTFILTFPTIPLSSAAGATYARFRFSADTAAANPTGAAAGGEVEDYAATILLRSDGTIDSARTKKIASGTNGGPTLVNIDQFGSSVSSLGDLDGDGVTDMAVGAREDNTGGTDRGAVYVQFMKADGSVKGIVKIASGMNGGPTLANNDSFGVSVASIGDVNGDGIIDMCVGANGDDTGGTDRGSVYVLMLNTDGTVKFSVKIASEIGGGPILADGDLFGHSVTALGDVDGDSVTDVAIGAERDDTGGVDRGAMFVLLLDVNGGVKNSFKVGSGLNGGPDLVNDDYFGGSVASLGDLDGDGVSDIAVGAKYDDTGGSNRGAVYVLMLNGSGSVKSSVKLASETNGGPLLKNNDRFGVSLASLGDLDGDGVNDLAVGALLDDTGGLDRGAVYVLLMTASGTAKRSVKLASDMNGGPTLANGDLFGSSVTTLGDLNGDGVTELVVGARGDNTGGTRRGAAYVLSLNTLLPNHAPTLDLSLPPLTPNTVLPQLVADLNPGAPSSIVGPIEVVNGVAYFAAETPTSGVELWRSDGTPAGTMLVKDIFPGPASSQPSELTNVGGVLFFRANDGATGFEVWKSDGTANGTVLVKDIVVGDLSSHPGNFTDVNGKLFFTAADQPSGTTEFFGPSPYLSSADSPFDLSELGTNFFLENFEDGLLNTPGVTAIGGSVRAPSNQTDSVDADDGVIDGDGNLGHDYLVRPGWLGVTFVFDANVLGGLPSYAGIVTTNGFGGSPSSLVEYFDAAGTLITQQSNTVENVNTTPADDRFLGVFHAGGIKMIRVSSLGTGNSGLEVDHLQYGSIVQPTSSAALWASDGTPDGTRLLKEFAFNADFSAVPLNGNLIFTANDGVSGAELWVSNGTPAGTTQILDINAGAASSNPKSLVTINGTAYFQANDGLTGPELWKTDGLPGGTVLVSDIRSGASGANPAQLTNVNGILFFSAATAAGGTELWKSDGTEAGTILVKDVRPGVNGSGVSVLTAVDDTLYFIANDNIRLFELWKSDGTEAGTVMVKDIMPGGNSSNPMSLSSIGGRLFLSALVSTSGHELWFSDGTNPGTALIKDINRGVDWSAPLYITALPHWIIFTANDGTSGRELWAASSDAMSVLEDADTQTINLTAISAGLGETQTLTITATSDNPDLIPDPLIDYTNPNAIGTLSFKPASNKFGTATITITVKDDGGTAAGGVDTLIRTFTVVVTPVNDPPKFTPGLIPPVTDESGPQSVAATDISAGPNEAGQQLTFQIVTNTNSSLFAVPPSIDSAGTLTFTPQFNVAGRATITVALQDDGGTASGGSDTSAQETFTIDVAKFRVWHNARSSLDVIADGTLAAADALEVINLLNAFGSVEVPTDGRPTGPYYDTNGDGTVAANDALDVINYLNAFGSGPAPEGEGESAAEWLPQSSAGAFLRSSIGYEDDLLTLLALEQSLQPKRRR